MWIRLRKSEKRSQPSFERCWELCLPWLYQADDYRKEEEEDEWVEKNMPKLRRTGWTKEEEETEYTHTHSRTKKQTRKIAKWKLSSLAIPCISERVRQQDGRVSASGRLAADRVQLQCRRRLRSVVVVKFGGLKQKDGEGEE